MITIANAYLPMATIVGAEPTPQRYLSAAALL